MDVQRIPPQDASKLIRSLVGDHRLSMEDTLALYGETEGNPFFLRELLYLLVERGELAHVDGLVVAARQIEPCHVPESIRGTIRARVRHLPQPLRRTLDAASVVGAVFDSDLVASAIEQRQIEILEELRDLEQIHSMVVRLNGHHRFYHVKIQETLYDELPPQLRARYHAAVAQALTRRGGFEADEGAAAHFLQAGDSQTALRLFGKTAERLVESQNWHSAKQVLDRVIALELAEGSEGGVDSLARAYYLRGLALYHAGRYPGALQDATESLKSRTGAPSANAEAHHLAGRAAYFLGDKSRCLEAYRLSLELAEASGRWELAFRNHLSLAAAHDQFGDYIAMEDHFRRASDLASEHDDPRARAALLMRHGMMVMDEPLVVIPKVEEARGLFGAHGDARGVAACEHNLGNEYFYLRELQHAERHFLQSLAIFDNSGGTEQCYPLNNLGMVYQVNGRLSESEGMLGRALDCHLTEYHRLFILNNLANSRRLGGSPDDSARILEGILPAVEADRDPVTPETTFYNLGMAYIDLGLFRKAVSSLERSFSDRTKSNAALNRGKRWKALARAYEGLGDAARAGFCRAKAAELLQSSVPDLWYYRDLDWEVADLAFYE
jgi:tetratricopeptide (TPR) repeat protein